MVNSIMYLKMDVKTIGGYALRGNAPPILLWLFVLFIYYAGVACTRAYTPLASARRMRVPILARKLITVP